VAQGTSSPALDVAGIIDKPVGGPDDADSETKKEEEDLDKQARRAQIISIKQDIEERKKYAGRIFCLLSLWLIGLFVLLLLQGFLSPLHYFFLSEAVLLATIGGTTLNVIGIFIVVARYLFPRRPEEELPMRERRPRR
jgi:hypothetical protein